MSMDEVVLVTGASSRIGAGIAHELAAAGVTVMLGARRVDRLDALVAEIAAAGGAAQAREFDVTVGADVAAFAEYARAAWGRVDVIVNNASVMPLSPMASMKLDEWDRMADVNIKGVMHGIAAVLPEMTARGSGHIVNIGSIATLRAVPTAATRVTCVHPGVVEGELADTITDPATAVMMREWRAIALKPDPIARAVRFATEQPEDVDVNEINVRPTRSSH